MCTGANYYDPWFGRCVGACVHGYSLSGAMTCSHHAHARLLMPPNSPPTYTCALHHVRPYARARLSQPLLVAGLQRCPALR